MSKASNNEEDLIVALKLFNEGTTALDIGDFGLAEIRLVACLSLVPERESVKQNLAITFSLKAQNLIEKGQFQDALSACETALNFNPKAAIALYTKGVLVGLQMDDVKQAISLLRQAQECDPENVATQLALATFYEKVQRFDKVLDVCKELPDTFQQRVEVRVLKAVALMQLGRHEEALVSYGRALELNPDSAEIWNNHGIPLVALGRHREALESYDRAILLNQNIPEVWLNRGDALGALSLYPEALENYARAIDLKPDYAEAWNNRGNALNALKSHERALESYRKAIELKPNYAEAWGNQGVALNGIKSYEEALTSFERAIELKPSYAEAWGNRGNSLRALKRQDEALISHERATELKPDYAEAWNNRGVTLNDLRRYEEALESYQQAIDLKPDYAEAWSNRGVTLNDLRRYEEALESYQQAIELKPDYADAYWNKSLHLLRLGDFDQGWQLYEWRWRRDEFTSPSRNFPQPLWLGDASLEGGTILLHSEQGFGDSIQFCRYARLVKKLGARVVLEIESPLVELFTTLEGVDEIVGKGAMLPHFDYHCPLLSLPLAFKTTATKIPHDVPYLYSGKAKREQWAQHLALSRDKPSIGIVWSGNRKHKNDHNRSIRLEDMSKVFSDKFHWFSVQKDVSKAEHLLLRSAGVRDQSAMLRDFSDTAGLISQLDLVIAVDTSVAHLAGALGKPVWVLLPYVPDFRWMWDREDSPWYPHMRLFRQSAEGCWDTAIARVGQELFQTFDV